MRKVVLITGGGRGIGAATATLAAKKGYQVCVNYSNNKEAAHKVVDFINRNGGKAFAYQADVSVESQVIELYNAIDNELGKLTALVNNAGIIEKQANVENMTAQRLQRVFNVNIVGSFLCAREAIKRMSLRHGGSGGVIVNVSSKASIGGSPGEYVDYAASKGAIDTFTVGLAKEIIDDGIRVNAVRPGVIITEIHASGGEPGRVDRIKDSIPMKRAGDPEEVANAILWLMSTEASYCTGTILDVTGGR